MSGETIPFHDRDAGGRDAARVPAKIKKGKEIGMGILIGVFSVAIFMDLRYYRIPNACIAAGIVVGLIMTYASESSSGLLAAASSMLIIFLFFYPFYLLSGIGAGDVKLFMMVGCYIRGDGLIHYMFVTMLTAAFFSILKMVLYVEGRERLLYLMRYIRKAVLTGAMDEYHIDKSQKKCVIRLSIPAMIGLLLMYFGVS